MSLESRTAEYLRTLRVLKRGASFLLAVSGGLDSMVMLHLFNRLKPRWDLRLSFAYIHHGLRREADEEVTFLENIGREQSIPFFHKRVDVNAVHDMTKSSIQEVARSLRYDALEALRASCNAEWIATGHHADDQAETILLRVLSGSGIDALAGIRSVNGHIVRPLLNATRRELEAFAHSNAIAWMEDASNEEDAYRRNALRHHVLPAIQQWINPSVTATLSESARRFSELSEFLRHETMQLRKRWVEMQRDSATMNLKAVKTALPFQQALVIHDVLRSISASEPSVGDIEAVRGLIYAESGSSATLTHSLVAYRDASHITIAESFTEELQERTVSLGERILLPVGEFSSSVEAQPSFTPDTSVEYIDLEAAGTSWKLRPWRKGDRFHPLGVRGQKKVSDFFSEMRVPVRARRTVPLLEGESGIIWVCGLRIDERFRIRENSKKIARLQFIHH